jgi:excisionase family DNA binding protein
MTTAVSNERLVQFLNASSEQQEAIDAILSGKQPEARAGSGPLLLGMTNAAKFLGVSRATLWRMIRAGRLARIEVLPGSYRVRRRDLLAIADGKGVTHD